MLPRIDHLMWGVPDLDAGVRAVEQLFGREPKLLTHEVVNVYKRSWAYDSSRAIRELGYEITPLEEGLARMVGSQRQQGLIR